MSVLRVAGSSLALFLTRKGLIASASAIALVGASVGVALGSPAPAGHQHSSDLAAPAFPASVYVPVTTNRIVDTRINLGITGQLPRNVSRTFQVTDLHPTDDSMNVPDEAVGVTGNLTVDNQTAAGFFAITAEAVNPPTTSSLNFPLGDIRANGVTVPLNQTMANQGRTWVVYGAPSSRRTHFILDVTGYFAP